MQSNPKTPKNIQKLDKTIKLNLLPSQTFHFHPFESHFPFTFKGAKPPKTPNSPPQLLHWGGSKTLIFILHVNRAIRPNLPNHAGDPELLTLGIPWLV